MSRVVPEDGKVGGEGEQTFLDSDSNSDSDSDSQNYHGSDSASDWDPEYDSKGFDRYYDYGDLDETGGNYVVQLENDREVSLEEHARTCKCDFQSGSHLSISCGKNM